MYSGQEIVSQEECKIVLAEFYEGVDCYNKTDNTIKFTLQDWALATYDSGTQTLDTPNFSCRPLIITEDITMIFEAGIPAGTTGLEVIMHTAEYTRTRIMPLMYIRECNSWHSPVYDTPYIHEACNTLENTTLIILGTIDSFDSTSITVVGYLKDSISEPLVLQFLDDADQIMTIAPTFKTEIIQVSEWVYNEDTKEYDEILVGKEAVFITLAIAKSLQVTGAFEYTYVLYPCAYYPGPDSPYIEEACNTETNTTLVIFGLIDSTTATSIIITGYDGDLATADTLQFLDDNDQVMTIAPVFDSEVRSIREWVWNENKNIYEEVLTDKTVVLISLAIAKSLQVTGSYNYTYILYPCAYYPGPDPDPDPDPIPDPDPDTLSYCNYTLPMYETKITSVSDDFTAPGGTGLAKLGNTYFYLKDSSDNQHTQFKRMHLDDSDPENILYEYYFHGAAQICFVDSSSQAHTCYDIYPCEDNPEPGFSISIVEYFTGENLFLDIALTGYFTILDNTVIDNTTEDIYRFFEDKSSAAININVEAEPELLYTTAVTNDCHTYYTINDGVRNETTLKGGYPVSDNARVIWTQDKCKFIVTCESIGSLPCQPCLICENEPDEESAHVYTDTSNEDCKSKKDYIQACQANTICALGNYPTIPMVHPSIPTPGNADVEYVFFSGSSMYLRLPGFGYTYNVHIGDLSYDVEIKTVHDEATDKDIEVSFMAFLYLSVFKFPFEYVTTFGISGMLWSDGDIWGANPPTSIEKNLEGITSAADYDFKIKLSTLKEKLPSQWQTGFNWTQACAWIEADIKKGYKKVNEIYNVENVSEIDNLVCDLSTKVNYRSSNVPLMNGVGEPPDLEWAFGTEYNKYCEVVKLLVSKEAEVYAYYNGDYKESQKSPLEKLKDPS